MQGQALPATRFFLKMDKRGALVAADRLTALVGNPSAHTLAPQCQGECGKPQRSSPTPSLSQGIR